MASGLMGLGLDPETLQYMIEHSLRQGGVPQSQPPLQPSPFRNEVPAELPTGGFADRLALGLSQMPEAPASSGFAGGLVSGLARGYSTGQLADLQRRKAFNANQQEQATQRNAENAKNEHAQELARLRWSMKKPSATGGAAADAGSYTLPDGTVVPMSPGVAAVVARAKMPNSQSGATTLSPKAIDLAARYWLKTGKMSGPAMRDTASRAAIMDRAGQMAAEAGGSDITTNAADVASQSKSLSSVQSMLSAVSAFENMANRNAEIMKSKMSKIVDTGSPIFNVPLRAMDAQLLGSPEMAAFTAALGPVVAEYSRILNNPTLSGVLTDTARREGSHLIDGSYTVPQMINAVGVLQNEAAGRRQFLAQQRQELLGGIRGVAGTAVPAGRIRVRDKKSGQTGTIPTGEWDATKYERMQ